MASLHRVLTRQSAEVVDNAFQPIPSDTEQSVVKLAQDYFSFDNLTDLEKSVVRILANLKTRTLESKEVAIVDKKELLRDSSTQGLCLEAIFAPFFVQPPQETTTISYIDGLLLSFIKNQQNLAKLNLEEETNKLQN
ncbi:MAG: hypothetical protein EB053_07205, partial [Chlamydiae bacterium]|nr:hypothetical protein [Chlamydiota bacterium]